MDSVLRDVPRVFVYLDDILLASESAEEHSADLTHLFNCLETNGLVVNRAKRVLGVPTVDFLGYRVSAEGTTPLLDKVTAVCAFPRPSTVKELQHYLGMINYYHRFVPHVAAVLHYTRRCKGVRSRKSLFGHLNLCRVQHLSHS